ncbi:hypothetical protein BJF90_45630 [Pseudonocardia sp. CNS-004]|nr:hypothetical protein BJF90_45630 [Pseudonocardia sp. CNS-004]
MVTVPALTGVPGRIGVAGTSGPAGTGGTQTVRGRGAGPTNGSGAIDARTAAAAASGMTRPLGVRPVLAATTGARTVVKVLLRAGGAGSPTRATGPVAARIGSSGPTGRRRRSHRGCRNRP